MPAGLITVVTGWAVVAEAVIAVPIGSTAVPTASAMKVSRFHVVAPVSVDRQFVLHPEQCVEGAVGARG